MANSAAGALPAIGAAALTGPLAPYTAGALFGAEQLGTFRRTEACLCGSRAVARIAASSRIAGGAALEPLSPSYWWPMHIAPSLRHTSACATLALGAMLRAIGWEPRPERP